MINQFLFIPKDIPNHIAKDYSEASIVINDSPKASAALGRRCLQSILREKNPDIKQGNLSNEINQVIGIGNLPSDISESLDVIREIGNFAAHPNKDLHTGEVLPVEDGESEWVLDVIEMLFDFYYVLPAKSKAKKNKINEKLKKAGKREIL